MPLSTMPLFTMPQSAIPQSAAPPPAMAVVQRGRGSLGRGCANVIAMVDHRSILALS
ncbi:MAG: hypothetical protein ACRC4U_02615 [Shewanella sp.]